MSLGVPRTVRGGMTVGASKDAPGQGVPSSRPTVVGGNRQKVKLTPGHSTLDWARLKASHGGSLVTWHATPKERRGGGGGGGAFLTRQMVAEHGSRQESPWTILDGRVYDLTAYLPFHPGGREALLEGAGCDATGMFNEVHPWVNYERMLDACLIGTLV